MRRYVRPWCDFFARAHGLTRAAAGKDLHLAVALVSGVFAITRQGGYRVDYLVLRKVYSEAGPGEAQEAGRFHGRFYAR